MSNLKPLHRRITAALLPQNCVLCGDDEQVDGQTTWRTSLLCTACRKDLPHLGANCCPVCALPSAGAEVCGRCLAEPPRFDATWAALAYAYPVEALIHHYKYRGAVALAALFGDLLDAAIADSPDPDIVVAIPLSDARLAERGFNQALEIARPLAKRRRLVLRAGLCVRLRHTGAQADLPLGERRKNVRGAFVCMEDLRGAKVAVVDDVMTTGATLDEFARTLKNRGAAQVVNWVVARTLPRD